MGIYSDSGDGVAEINRDYLEREYGGIFDIGIGSDRAFALNHMVVPMHILLPRQPEEGPVQISVQRPEGTERYKEEDIHKIQRGVMESQFIEGENGYPARNVVNAEVGVEEIEPFLNEMVDIASQYPIILEGEGIVRLNPDVIEEEYDRLHTRSTTRNGVVVEHDELPIEAGLPGYSGGRWNIEIKDRGLRDEEVDEIEARLLDEDGINASKIYSSLRVFNREVELPGELKYVLDELEGLEVGREVSYQG